MRGGRGKRRYPLGDVFQGAAEELSVQLAEQGEQHDPGLLGLVPFVHLLQGNRGVLSRHGGQALAEDLHQGFSVGWWEEWQTL